MSSSSSDYKSGCNSSTAAMSQKKYKGIRCRKWGKWVSEIRVPGTAERLWLGSYATPEGAAMAHDVAFYCLRGDSSPQNLNFPSILPPGARVGLSPRSVQKAASDAGLAIDAHYIGNSTNRELNSQIHSLHSSQPTNDQQQQLSISVDDYL